MEGGGGRVGGRRYDIVVFTTLYNCSVSTILSHATIDLLCFILYVCKEMF